MLPIPIPPPRGRALFLAPLALFTMLGALAARATAQPTTTSAPGSDAAAGAPAVDLQARLPLDPKATLKTLPNGLRYYIHVNHEPRQRAELRLVINAGSILEQDDQQGLAHFVEHMAFNGTKHFKAQQLVDYLERAGMRFGPDINAYTSFDETVYMLTIPTDDQAVLAKAFQVLEDWARWLRFDPKEVHKERGVVIEEWRLRRGAGQRILDQQYPVLLHGSLYAKRLPIGQKDLLETFPREALVRFYRQWYRPELMAVIAVGDFDDAKVERWIREHFGRIPASRPPVQRPDHPVPGHDQTLFAIATDPEATSSRITVTLKRPAESHATVGDYRRDLIDNLYSGMFNARLGEILQKPDPPFLGAFTGSGSLVRGTESLSLSASAENNGLPRALTALLTEAARVQRHGFTASELERRKKSLLRGLEQRWQEREKTDSGVFADAYVDHFLEQDPAPGIEYRYALAQQIVPGIALEEVNALSRDWLGESSRVVMESGPQKEGVTVPVEDELRGIFTAAAAAEVEPYHDVVNEAALVAQPPPPATIVEEVAYDALGVTRWQLSNGVRVWLKPTDFQQDELLFSGLHPGGTSLAADDGLPSVELATTIVGAGGVGEFSAVELQKRLAGRSLRVSPFVTELTEGVQGGCSLADAQTCFELLYLCFTAPRRDPEAFASLKERLGAIVANRALDPNQAFSDTLAVTMAQHHPRVRPLSSETVATLDLDAALAFYKDRFADASGFSFALVGSFQLDQVRPLVLQWLGGLPALQRAETWRDTGIRPPTGVVRKTVLRGKEPKSQTQIVFTGPLEWKRENRYALQSLADVLQLRLREVLREDLSGTYSVSASAGTDRDPFPRYRVAVSFGCDPHRLDELSQEVFRVIERLQQEGVAAGDVTKVREEQRRDYETSLRSNGYWLAQLMYRDRYGLDPGEILTYADLVKGLDAATLQDAARRYLHADNYVQVSLRPQ
jgi:zinc protease